MRLREGEESLSLPSTKAFLARLATPSNAIVSGAEFTVSAVFTVPPASSSSGSADEPSMLTASPCQMPFAVTVAALSSAGQSSVAERPVRISSSSPSGAARRMIRPSCISSVASAPSGSAPRSGFAGSFLSSPLAAAIAVSSLPPDENAGSIRSPCRASRRMVGRTSRTRVNTVSPVSAASAERSICTCSASIAGGASASHGDRTTLSRSALKEGQTWIVGADSSVTR